MAVLVETGLEAQACSSEAVQAVAASKTFARAVRWSRQRPQHQQRHRQPYQVEQFRRTASSSLPGHWEEVTILEEALRREATCLACRWSIHWAAMKARVERTVVLLPADVGYHRLRVARLPTEVVWTIVAGIGRDETSVDEGTLQPSS